MYSVWPAEKTATASVPPETSQKEFGDVGIDLVHNEIQGDKGCEDQQSPEQALFKFPENQGKYRKLILKAQFQTQFPAVLIEDSAFPVLMNETYFGADENYLP